MGKHRAGAARGRTINRWGSAIGKGSVVRTRDGQKGIVVRLEPYNDFSRAYGRQATVRFVRGASGAAFDREIGIDDLNVIGRAKRVPKTYEAQFPRSADEIAHHEKIRDIRRAGQGSSYDPAASHNKSYENPLPPWIETRIVRKRKGK